MTNKSTKTVDVLNAVRASASPEYRANVPVATANNLQDVGNPILNYTATMNEFISTLVNKVAMTIVENRIFENPLAMLKQGYIPLGKDVEEIYTNPAKAVVYNMEATTELLARTPPDVKAAYHRLNREDQYPVTITNQVLRRAFTSWDNMESLIASIVNSLYSGDNIDEYNYMKTLIGTAINSGFMNTTYLGGALTDEDSAKAFVKQFKSISGKMQFPSSAYNAYGLISPGNSVTTWTPKDRQVLFMTSDALAVTDVDVLAFAFHMDKAQFLGRIIEVDNFGEYGLAANTVAVIADEGWMKVFDNLNEMSEFYNAKSLSWNYYWNHWQTLSYSPFANAVAFVAAADGQIPSITTATVPEGTVNTPYTSTTLQATGATPITWKVAGGNALPAGLSLAESTGVISGTPTVAGTTEVLITATNSAGTAAKTFTFVINNA